MERELEPPTVNVLYLFAGAKRRLAMSHFLRVFAKQHNFRLVIHEVDILRSRRHDLAKHENQQFWLDKLQKGTYQVLLCSPPCSTFTRAVWANHLGPRPIRSLVHPRGFKWLSFQKRKLAELGNCLADYSYKAMETILQQPDTVAVMEQPEDLGANKGGPWPGVRPASMWQFEQFDKLLLQDGVQTAAFYQADFGTKYAKPTRILFRLHCELSQKLYLGKPTFDQYGFYSGPLPPLKRNMQSLQRQSTDSGFRTSGTAAWPPGLCKWLSESCMQSLTNTGFGADSPVRKRRKLDCDDIKHKNPPTETGDDIKHKNPPTETVFEFPPPHPMVKADETDIFRPGDGPPRHCTMLSKTSPFHDGAGLLSPGRWNPENRIYPGKEFENLRSGLLDYALNHFGNQENLQHACLRLAVSKQNIFDESLVSALRKYVANWCVSHGSNEERNAESLLEIDEGQPFYLKLLKAVLKAAGDGDHNFLEQAREGLPVGVLNPLPRTPLMFEEQTEWRLEDDPLQQPLTQVDNYVSAELRADYVYEFFETEISEGLMGKMAEDDFFKTFGQHTAVAALAVLEEKNGKKRIIHDATHGVRVNHRIRCRDKQRMPGPKEKFYLLSRYKDANEVVFSVLADVSKAHRRFKHCKEEWGYISCKVRAADNVVYYNKVGTFGVASASYWWSRIFAAIVRAVHYLLGKDFPIDMLVYADDIECLGAGKAGRKGIVLAFLIMEIFATPFRWAKTRGGLQTDWIGLRTDYRRYMLGLSTVRAEWLTNWCRQVASEQLILPRTFAAGLGRLCFSANALIWQRPFLGPLFAWSSAVGHIHKEVRVPWAICFILLYLADRFEKGDRLMPPPLLRTELGLLFKTDARADEEEAWVGGWQPHPSGSLRKSKWFALQVTKDWAPWAFTKNNPQRMIASLELLGTVLGVIFFSKDWPRGASGSMMGQAITDNLGNSFVVAKQMTTKYPVTLLLMELTEWLKDLDMVLDLKWVPREQNGEADALSNMDVKDFDAQLRIDIQPEHIPWKIMNKLLKASEELYLTIVETKQDRSHSIEARPSHRKVKLLDDW